MQQNTIKVFSNQNVRNNLIVRYITDSQADMEHKIYRGMEKTEPNQNKNKT